MHVKGHSDDGGNDHADELVQWGKEDGPYARLRNGGGEGESCFRAAAPCLGRQRERGTAAVAPMGSAAAEAALELEEFELNET